MNRKLLLWGIVVVVFARHVSGALAPSYEFAVVSNSVTAGLNLNAVANSGNVFVCVGAQSSPVLEVNTNGFAGFQNKNVNGGFLLFSNAWTKTPKNFWFNCVATQTNGFIAAGASNAVYVSSDGLNWTKTGNILPAGDQAYSAEGVTYNPVSRTYAAALSVYEASYTTNLTNGWTAANFQSQSFAEAFRAITSFGLGDMALCGVLGDIRISTNGGQYWNLSQQANLDRPSLLSVASDGANSLVCAGDNSLIEVSTNAGPNATWLDQTKLNIGASGSVTDFSAVAYSPAADAFLGAGTLGANGLIVIAPELLNGGNWTWTRQTNFWAFQNGNLAPVTPSLSTLNGASIATSGFFQGIVLIVGNNGNVIVGGFAPPAPVNSSNLDFTNILTSPPTNFIVLPTVIGDAYHPISVLAVDWYTSATGGSPVALNTLGYEPTNESCGTYTNWAQERDLRTGFVSTNRTSFVFTIIPAAPSNPLSATNCGAANGNFGMCDTTPLSVTVLTNAANLPGSIRVNWYDGNSNLVASDTYSNDSDVVTFTPTNTTPGIYTFYAQATNPATGFVSANWTALTFQVNELPQWTSSAGIVTNALLSNPQANPSIPNPSVANLSGITSIEPGATIAYDWYTNSDPTVSTYDNPNAPFALTGVGGFPGVVEPAAGVISFIPTNVLCGTYTYYVRARVVAPSFASSTCTCQSTNLIPVTFVLLPPPPTDAIVNLTNVLTGAVQINTPIWVDLLTNAANPPSSFTVNWYAASNSVNNINNGSNTRLSNRFFHTPTNALCGVFTNWAETVATGSSGPVASAARNPVVFEIIPATPTALMALGAFDQTNCIEVPTPTFAVAVTNGQTADWFAVPSSGTPVTNGLSFTPTNSSVGTWQFAAEAVDPVSGLTSTGSVLATLNLYDCSQAPTINLNPANSTGTIQWPGNLTLLSTTNLTPPVIWTSVSTGSMFLAPNTLTFTNTNPPTQFFRLTN